MSQCLDEQSRLKKEAMALYDEAAELYRKSVQNQDGLKICQNKIALMALDKYLAQLGEE